MNRFLRFLLLVALVVPVGVQSQAPAGATELPLITNFEDASDDTSWHFNNTGNGWYIGAGTNNTSGGSRALYISNSNGSTHAYDPTIETMSYAYRPVYFETAGQYILEFDWINNGWYTYYFSGVFNMLYPYLIPGTVDMTVSPLEFDDYNWTPCTESYLGNVTTWQHATISLNITTPGVYYLAFIYYCYGIGGGNPPAAIDNLSLTSLGCLQPTALTVDSLSSSEVGIHWTPGGDEDAWLVRADDNEWLEIYDSSYLFTDLAASMRHSLEVVALCDNGDTSLATTVVQRTSCGTVSNYPWREDFSGFSGLMATIPCWTHLGSGSYRLPNGEMEIRTGDNTNASLMATPEIEGLSQLELTFTTHPEGAYSGSLSVGYITGTDENYVFTSIATYQLNEWVNPDTPIEKTVTFAGAPDTARIAFQYNPITVNWHWYIDDIDVHTQPMCVRPNYITLVDADESNLELAWSNDNGSGTTYTLYYRHADSIDWNMVTTTDTTIVLTGLESSSSYEVRLSASCSNGSSSTELTGTFMTACGTITTFPHEEGFDNGSALCWQVYSMNSSSTDNWLYTNDATDTRNFSTGAYASSYNSMEACNEWLVSPAIELPEDVSNFTLSWYSHAHAWSTNQPRVEVKVSTTPGSATFDTAAFSTTLYSESLNETNFVKHSVGLGQFAGQTIQLAFVRRGFDDYFVVLEDISIYPSQEPSVVIAGTPSPVVGLATTYRAVLDEGSRSGLTYTWISTAVTAGSATLTQVDSATVTLLYSSTASDVLTVVATNTYGSDTATLSINPVVATYTALPYSTGFEATDDVAWTLANDTANAWYIDTAAHHTGNRALYISNDNGQHNTYTLNATSYSYAYKSFNFAAAGQYGFEFDWRCYAEGVYDNLNVYLIPIGTTITAGTDAGNSWNTLTGQLNGANLWQHFSSIINLDIPGVYNLVFAWKNDYTMGENPPAAIDNLSVVAISCEAPTSVEFDVVGDDMASFHWRGNVSAYEVTVGDRAPVVVADTFYTVSTLLPATSYAVQVRAICGTGDTSLYASTTFTTDCLPSSIPFNYDFPGTSLSVCWTNSMFSPYPATSWSEGAGTNHRIYSAAAYNGLPSDDWLISPVIDIPASDTASLELIYFVNGYPNDNYLTSSANYEVLVSPTGSVASSSFTDTLFRENGLDTTAYMRRNFSMSQYGGQSIRVAFRNVSTYNGRIGLREVSIRRTHDPLFTVQGPSSVWINETNTFAAVYQEGEISSMSYSWTSTMAAAGNATLYGANNDTLSIVYHAVGIDTLTFVAHNSYGNDTIVTHVSVLDLNPVTIFPYSTGFEPSNTDNLSWIALNGTNGWSLGTATSHSGSSSYYISNDLGTTNAYTLNSTSRSYLYRAFNFSATGNYTVSFDWNAEGESNFDFLRVWLVPDTLFDVQANGYPVSGISGNYALSTADIPGWISVGGKLNLSSGWTTEADTVDIEASGRYYLVFLWVNDGSMGSQPPVAIDNVEVNNGTVAICDNPVIDSVVATETEIALSFSGNATQYEVAIVQGEWIESAVIGQQITVSSHLFTSLISGTQYTIGVRTVCDEDFYSDWVTCTVTTIEYPCYAPSEVVVANIEYTEASLAWTPAEEGQTDFQLRVTIAGESTLIDVTDNTVYHLTGLHNGTEYAVEVRAVCGEGRYSDWSPVTTFSTDTCTKAENVQVGNETAEGATVSWIGNAAAYDVAYGLPGESYDQCRHARVTETSYTITGLDNTTSYVVYVRSECETGIYSDWSDGVTFTTSTVGITDVDNESISLYPNPASSTVTLTGVEGEATVTVVDMNGRELYKLPTPNSQLKIDISQLSQGAYFVRITGERVNAIRKLIVR